LCAKKRRKGGHASLVTRHFFQVQYHAKER
jgi:hypothetical protein